MGKFSDLAKTIGRKYTAGEIIFKQGEDGDSMYLIYSGSMEVKHEIKGQSAVLGKLGPGDFFGEMSLVDAKPRSATVTARENSTLIPITAAFLRENILKDPHFIFQIIETLILRIDSTTRAMKGVTADGTISGSRSHSEVTDCSGLDMVKFFKIFSGYADPDKYLHFGEGDEIFKNDEAGDLMFIILEGAVRITLDVGGKTRDLAILERGDFFGETALITDLPRTASSYACDEVTLLPVVRKELVDGLISDPEAALQLVRILILRLRKSIENYGLGTEH